MPPAGSSRRAAAPAAPALGRPVRRRIAPPLILALAAALAAALLVLHSEVRYFRVGSGSMEPTLPVGTRLAVESGLPVRAGEIIAFHAPAGATAAAPTCAAPGEGAGFPQPCGAATAQPSGTVFVKRVVAGPGDAVAIRSGHAVIDGAIRAEPFAAPCGGGEGCDFPTAVRVPPGEYYVLGDNRGASDDSRYWGPVPVAWIIGVAVRCGPLQTLCHPWN